MRRNIRSRTNIRSRVLSAFLLAGLSSTLLAACNGLDGVPKHIRPLSYTTKSELLEAKMSPESEILLRIFKGDSELEVWKKRSDTGKFALFKTYDICKWSGELGPKIKEGDRQAPEGFYTVTPAQMNPRSSYHLSFNLGYPNAYDRAHERTGSHLMVHGACSSRGCYSMDDEQIQEIYSLARLSFQGGQQSFQVQAYPFRMTPANMAKNRGDPNYKFWKMLKEGNDHFEITHQAPKIDVCSKRYVFNSAVQPGIEYSPTGECPTEMSVHPSIQREVANKQARDEAKELIIASKLEKQNNGTGLALFGGGGGKKTETAEAVAQVGSPVTGSTTAPSVADASGEIPRDKPATHATAYAAAPEEDEGNMVSRLWNKVW